MRLPWILLPVLAQGVLGQVFEVEPQEYNVARQGEAVTLECVTRSPTKFCAWKLNTPDLGIAGFITSAVPENVDISARDPNSKTDCTVTINNVNERFNGNYTCSPYLSTGAQEDSRLAQVIVAQKPQAVAFTGSATGASRLSVSADQPSSVSCEARYARPRAELAWYLGSTQLYEGIEVADQVDPASQLVTSVSTLTHQFVKNDNGAQLRCVANHAGYDDQDNREVDITVDIQYAPYRSEGNNIGKIYGFTAGQQGEVKVNFTANPPPTRIIWTVGQNKRVESGGETLDGRFIAGGLETIDPVMGQYAATLVINPVRQEDENTAFQLQTDNELGKAVMDFVIGIGAAPPPEAALGTGAIVGIIVAVIALLVIIALVVIGRRSGKWCFAAKAGDAGAEADTESAHDEKTDKPEKKTFKFSNPFSSLVTKKKKETDVEMADNKEETKELTKADGEEAPQKDGDEPERKDGEVVYAELMLNSDGVKTEVRPSAEKSEYAVIVGTKKEEEEGKPQEKTEPEPKSE